MATYTLSINFSNSDLKTIKKSGQSVVLVRSLADQDPANVVWAAFDPFAANAVAWAGARILYASRSEIEDGGEIFKLNSAPAYERNKYTFQADGTFSDPVTDPGLKNGQYEVVNGYGAEAAMTFGLGEDVRFSDGRPLAQGGVINAVYVPRAQMAVLVPLEKVTLFLATGLRTGQVLPSTLLTRSAGRRIVYSKSITLAFGAGVTTIAVNYDSVAGGFVQVSAS